MLILELGENETTLEKKAEEDSLRKSHQEKTISRLDAANSRILAFSLCGWWQLVMNFMKLSKRVHFGCHWGMTSLHILYAQHFCSRQAIGWAPCPVLLSWASGRDWILGLKSKLLWLTLDFQEQDIEDKRMLWDHLGSKVTLGSVLGVCSHQRPPGKLGQRENCIFSQIPPIFPENKCLGQPLGFIPVSDKELSQATFTVNLIFSWARWVGGGDITISMVFPLENTVPVVLAHRAWQQPWNIAFEFNKYSKGIWGSISKQCYKELAFSTKIPCQPFLSWW